MLNKVRLKLQLPKSSSLQMKTKTKTLLCLLVFVLANKLLVKGLIQPRFSIVSWITIIYFCPLHGWIEETELLQRNWLQNGLQSSESHVHNCVKYKSSFNPDNLVLLSSYTRPSIKKPYMFCVTASKRITSHFSCL